MSWSEETSTAATYADESAVSASYTPESVQTENYTQEQLGILAANGGGSPIGILLTVTTSGDIFYDKYKWDESTSTRTVYTESSQ